MVGVIELALIIYFKAVKLKRKRSNPCQEEIRVLFLGDVKSILFYCADLVFCGRGRGKNINHRDLLLRLIPAIGGKNLQTSDHHSSELHAAGEREHAAY